MRTGELDLEQLDAIERRGSVRLVAVGSISNSIGTVNPVETIAAWARERGALTVVDACQAAPHRQVDVAASGADFVALTGHKMLAPSGIGVLWGRQELLSSMEPFNLGGEMIRSVSVEETTWNELPNKFEAGTPPIAQAYGLGLAIDYLTNIGIDQIEAHEHDLTTYAMEQLSASDGVAVLGPAAERRGGIVSFTPRLRSPARCRTDSRHAWGRGSRRPPLHAARDGALRHSRHDACELLSVQHACGRRSADRGARGRTCDLRLARCPISIASSYSTTTRTRATTASSTPAMPMHRVRTLFAATTSPSR